MKSLSEEILARYYDGELSEGKAREVRELLARSKPHQLTLDKMNRLGDLVRLMNDESLSSVSFDGFEQRVLLELNQREKPGAMERFKVWVSEFFEHRKALWVPAASLVGAAAAVLLVLPLLQNAPPASIQGPDQSGGLWQASAAGQFAPAGSEAVLVSRNDTTGMEYSVQNDRGENIGVVWINE